MPSKLTLFLFLVLASFLSILTVIMFHMTIVKPQRRLQGGFSDDKTNIRKCDNFRNIAQRGKIKAYSALVQRMMISMIWQAVDENCYFYVYSSYRDEFDWKIRVIGLGKRLKRTVKVKCFIWEDRSVQNPLIVAGNIRYLPGGRRNSYVCTITSCPIREGHRPFAVSLSVDNTEYVTNIVEVIYPHQEKVNVTVCTPVMHSNFKERNKTISIIEMNRLLGAQRFVIYYFSASAEVSAVLDGYVRNGFLEIVHWTLPTRQIHYYGQDAVNNDCLYRNMYTSRYIIFTDLDEVVIPKKHPNWLTFIESVEKNKSNTGSFLFQNSIFCTNRDLKPDLKKLSQSEEIMKYDITPLLRIWRDQTTFKWKSRSKQIVNAERVWVVRIHLIDKDMYRNGFKEYLVSPKDGLLHHYRLCRPDAEIYEDDSVRIYTKQLLTNVKQIHLSVKTIT